MLAASGHRLELSCTNEAARRTTYCWGLLVQRRIVDFVGVDEAQPSER